MATRVTRGTAAKEAAFLASTQKDAVLQQLSNPVATHALSKTKFPAAKKATTKKVGAKKVTAPKDTAKGPKAKAKTQIDLPIRFPTIVKKRKRPAAGPKFEEDLNDLPHNLGKAFVPNAAGVKEEVAEDPEPSPKKRSIEKISEEEQKPKDSAQTVEKTACTGTLAKSPRKKSAKTKDNPYGLSPGETPYPDWPHPTPEECYEVNNLLTTLHGKQGAPPKIPPPSLTITGCGEVPSILDALVRTLLSGNTTGLNSGRAMKGLVTKFGTLQEGIGKGSLDYNAIRRASLDEVIDAIKEGGMQKKKGMYIQMLLDIVYEENKARRDALVTAKEDGNSAAPKGAENESEEQKDAEIIRAEEHILSLDHIHHLEKDDAITTMTKFPQIGVKTAACVVLFCMRIPCFAVDTHVFRLSKWLGWVPPDVGADPITTFRHLEVRIPDELKYSLHQLFIKHGKSCPRCRAITGPNSEGWDKGCVIDHLVKRTGPTKQGLPRRTGTKGKKGKKADDSEEEDLDDEALADDSLDEDDVVDVGKKIKGQGSGGKGAKGKEKLKGTVKAQGKGKKGKNVRENGGLEDEDAAMEDLAHDIQEYSSKARGKASAVKVPKRKAKKGPDSHAKPTPTSKAKAPKGEESGHVTSDEDALNDDGDLEDAAIEELIVKRNKIAEEKINKKLQAGPKEGEKAKPNAK